MSVLAFAAVAEHTVTYYHITVYDTLRMPP